MPMRNYLGIIEHYMEGACYSLAIAHHQMFGWPLYVLGGYEDENERDDHRTITCFHAMVRHPSGKFVDIKGPQDGAKLIEEWGDCELLPLTQAQLLEILNPGIKPTQDSLRNAQQTIRSFMFRHYPDLYED